MSNTQAVQQKLNDLGYGPLTVDGVAGPMTTAAIKKFQTDKGLVADGIIGPKTLSALGIGDTGSTPIVQAPAKSWIVPIPSASISGIKQAVVDAFPSFSTKFEGYTPYMYADSKGFVTSGIGNKIDPVSDALNLPWRHADGSLATQAEITAAWQKVKSAYPGVQSTASQNLTDLRLDKAAIAQLVNGHMRGDAQYLRAKYPGYVNWPADAQLALHSIAWAWGPAFASVWGVNGQHFADAVNKPYPDFATASNVMKQSSQAEELRNRGIIPRDDANLQLWMNAQKVLDGKLSFDSLFFPSMPVKTFIKIGILEGAAVALATGFAIWKWGGVRK